MTIRIIEEPEIVLTRAEYESLRREWAASQQMTARPQSFESWLQGRRCAHDQAVSNSIYR